MSIRRALPSESKTLSELAAAKAVWGHSAAQFALWASDLYISPESIDGEPTFVAEQEDGHIAGVVQLCTQDRWAIEHLWVHPSAMRRGVGAELVRHALSYARERGQHELEVDSDPQAERFYLRLGARRVGEVAAPVEEEPGRVRPQLVLSTAHSA